MFQPVLGPIGNLTSGRGGMTDGIAYPVTC